jgi:hypothetical protein
MHKYYESRKLWKQHHGPIPLDAAGRRYEIHHIDGNSSNNVIENLACISIEEHLEIHRKQKDWGACFGIMQRMSFTSQELSEMATKARIEQKKRDPMWQVGERNGHYGKPHSDETKQIMREKKLGKYDGKKNPMYGKNHSEEARRKVAETMKGTQWITNGEMTRKLRPGEEMPPGFEKGRRLYHTVTFSL